MINVWFFHGVDPTPPSDGIYRGIGLVAREWQYCEITLSSGEEIERMVVSFPGTEWGFREMIIKLEIAGIEGAFASFELMTQFDYYHTRFANHFTGKLDYLSEAVVMPPALLTAIVGDRHVGTVH